MNECQNENTKFLTVSYFPMIINEFGNLNYHEMV